MAVDIIRRSGANIICLQETTPQWEAYLKRELAGEYSLAEFRNSPARMGGGLAFLTKLPAREIAYIPSETGWFDGWIMLFQTDVGPVQVVNVHLRPPISDSGSWVSGYFNTGDDRLDEIKRFYAERQPDVPTLVVGDFNDTEHSAVIRWLNSQGMTNALPEFDRHTPTWRWPTSVYTFKRRMDHIVYSTGLHCCGAAVLQAGASDHFPVLAEFSKPGREP